MCDTQLTLFCCSKKIQKDIDQEYLMKEAERFGLKNQVIGMLEFLDIHKRSEGQPLLTWNEFITKQMIMRLMT